MANLQTTEPVPSSYSLDLISSMSTQRVRTLYTITLFIMDVVGIIVGFLLAYYVRLWMLTSVFDLPLDDIANHQIYDKDYRLEDLYFGYMLVYVLSIILVFLFSRQYDVARAPSRLTTIYTMCKQVSIGTILGIAAAVFLFKEGEIIRDFPRVVVICAWAITILLVILNRFVHQLGRDFIRKRGIDRDRLLIIGSGNVARLTLQKIQWSPQLGYDVIGAVTMGSEETLLDVPVLGRPENLPALIEDLKISEVIIAMPEEGHQEVINVVEYCQRGRISIKIFPDVFQFVTSEATIDDLGGLPLLTVRDFTQRGYMLFFKRLLDISGALFGLILLSPIMLLVAILIKVESKGPAFFIQERMGLDGKPFKIVKFRSMRMDAEDSGPGWTVKDDPRKTRVGGFLRKSNLDELPQLINVLIGEMSLVGPRPEQPYYVEQFRQNVPKYMARHQLRAGMTGWAQVNGYRGDTSIEERTKYDVWYIENWSLGLDVSIIVRTIWQTISGRNHGAE